MFRIVLTASVALLVLGCCQISLGQHWGGHGGHFGFHNGHVDYHQPTHFDYQNGHLDLYRGHVDYVYPSTYSYPNNYYYPNSSPLYSNNTYNPSGTIVSSTPGNLSQLSSAPTNALPGNSVVTGYAPNQGPINIINPEKYGTPLSFKLNGQIVRLEPGQSNTIKFDRNYIIEFHRGGDFGTAKYSLRDGDFQFVVGDNGWDLNKVRVDANPIPQIDNSVLQNPLPGR
jgi:hypothetical protein